MTPSHHLLSRALERELIVHRVPDQARKLAEAIKLLSYDLGLDAAPVDDPGDLQKALHLERRDFERAEKYLLEMKLLRVVRGGGRFWYELLPLPDQWPDRPASRGDGFSARAPSFAAMDLARAAWTRLEKGVVTEPAQGELPMPLAAAQKHRDSGAAEQAAAENRNEALARAERERRRAQFREHIEFGGISPKTSDRDADLGEIPPDLETGLGGNSPKLQPPARPRARHVHVPTSVPQSMVHVHEHVRSGADLPESRLRLLNMNALEEQLDDESRYWSGQLADIFGVESARKFRRTWLLRFCDRWQTAAFKAIGETKRRISTGEGFRKGPGEYANDLFHRFKHEGKAQVVAK